ncbi:MAG: hypothetical protein LBO74_11560, partial [Candidatus Symbiothrix sp.]|nr:hypothetical protein [Candidatus Symbiothrix sp.]
GKYHFSGNTTANDIQILPGVPAISLPVTVEGYVTVDKKVKTLLIHVLVDGSAFDLNLDLSFNGTAN